MKIVKIKGSFVVDIPSINVFNTTGYVTEDGGVYINIKGKTLSREQIKNNLLSIIGFQVTSAKVDEIESVYDMAEKMFFEESSNKGVEENVQEVVSEESADEPEEVDSAESTPKRRGRGRARK